MTLTPTSDSSSIFENGKLKPGIYKIQNIYGETYLDIELHSRNWEIKQFGVGYTVQRVDPGNPDQFCTPLDGIQPGAKLRVGAYPVAWKVGIVDDGDHQGFEYVRFYWATSNILWDFAGALAKAGDPNAVLIEVHLGVSHHTWQMWKLVPVKVDSTPLLPRSPVETGGPGTLPSYNSDPGQSSTRAHHTGYEHDESGTFVNEVSVVTTTVTTRKRYRVEDS